VTRRNAFATPTAGYVLAATETSRADLLAALALVIPPGSAFSHITAAQVLDLPVPGRLRNAVPVHVTVPTGAARGTRKQVRWHRAGIDGHVITAGDLRVTDPVRTWVDLGRHLPLPQLVAVADVILRRGPSTRLVVPAGVRGATDLRAASTLANPGSRSPQESILRVHLHLAHLPAPQVNFDVKHLGEWIGCGDLVWPEFKLYLECDGLHHQDPRQRHQDAQTRNRLGQLGWTVRVVTSQMIRRPYEVVAMVAEDLRANGWPG